MHTSIRLRYITLELPDCSIIAFHIEPCNALRKLLPICGLPAGFARFKPDAFNSVLHCRKLVMYNGNEAHDNLCLQTKVLQPGRRHYGGQGYAKDSVFVELTDPAYAGRCKLLWDEHIAGFSGKVPLHLRYSEVSLPQHMMSNKFGVQAVPW